MITTYQLEKIRQERQEDELFRTNFNDALRKNARKRIFWMLQEKELKKYSPDEILPKELFEI